MLYMIYMDFVDLIYVFIYIYMIYYGLYGFIMIYNVFFTWIYRGFIPKIVHKLIKDG